MDKANLNEKEKIEYKRQLEENERQIERLKREQFIAQREARKLRSRIMESNELEDRWEPNDQILLEVLNGEKRKFSRSIIRKLMAQGYLDDEGNVNEERILNELAMRSYRRQT